MKKREPQHYIDNKLKPPKAFFDWCNSQIHTYKWMNKKKTILASDRKNCYVIEKRLTKRTNLNFFDKFYSFAIILVTSRRIEVQSYCYWSKIVDGKQVLETELVNFEHFSNDQHIQLTKRYEERYVKGLSPNYGWGGAYTDTEFYPNDWQERIKNISELRFLKFSRNTFNLDSIYKYRKEIEFLQKINARKLAEEVMYPSYNYAGRSCTKNVDMRTINEQWLRKNKQFFKNSDRTFLEYELERRIKERNGKVVPGIERYLDYRDINKIPKGVGIVSFQNWMIKNEVDFKYYLDYLSLLKDLKVTLDSKNLIMPKNLRAAHDNAVNLLNQLKREIDDQEYKKRKKALLKMEREIDEFAFVVPKELNELVTEGKVLHHCVGGSMYVEQHKKGKTTIVFIRKKEDPDKPMYTMEYKRGQIIQIRGKHNQGPPKEIKNAADHWLKEVVNN